MGQREAGFYSPNTRCNKLNIKCNNVEEFLIVFA